MISGDHGHEGNVDRKEMGRKRKEVRSDRAQVSPDGRKAEEGKGLGGGDTKAAQAEKKGKVKCEGKGTK